MVVFLLYEHLTREWNALQKLKDELEKRGAETAVYSIIYERTKAIRKARKKKPDIIVVPWFVDESHEKILYPFIEINNKVKIINMHHEEIGCDASESVFFPKTAYTSNGSYHLAWGDFFKDKLVQNGVEANRIKITGNVRNDSASRPLTDRKEISDKYQLNINKPWILFAENRGYYIQRVSDDLRHELNRRGMPNEAIDLRASYEKESITTFIGEMEGWDKEKRCKFEFIYRPHPGTHAPENLPQWMRVIDDLSIYEWINVCDLFLTSCSTSIFEAEVCGKPCAIFESIDIPEQLKIYGLDEYPCIEHADEIDDLLIEKLTKNKPDRPYYEKYLGQVDGKAVERTADAIIEISKEAANNENLIPTLAKPSRKELFRHSVFEKLTYMMTKTSLLYILKFPKSAYSEVKDIPYSREADWIRRKQ